MAECYSRMWQTLVSVLFISTLACVSGKEKDVPIVLSEGNWTEMLQGEWLVEL